MVVDIATPTWGEIAEAGPRLGQHEFDGYVDEHKRRDAFITKYSFAVPPPEVIQRIAAFIGQDRLLEVGAGSGLWAQLLHDAGVDVRGDLVERVEDRLRQSAGLVAHREHVPCVDALHGGYLMGGRFAAEPDHLVADLPLRER